MGSRLTGVAVDCRDPETQAAFWAAALGYHVVHREEGQVEIGPWVSEPPDLAEQYGGLRVSERWCSRPFPKGRRSRTACTWTCGRSIARTLTRWSGLSALGPDVPTSVRATSPGWC